MRILLPPSEAKRPGGTGTPLGKRSRSGPLATPRSGVIEALSRFATPEDAAKGLHLPASSTAESLAANARVLEARTLPAIERYTGIVYDGLDVATLSPGARSLADRSVLIFSGLLGVSRGGDPVPAYRVPAKAALPGLGILATYWKPHLADAVPPLLDRALVVDLRSTDYAAMWTPSAAVASRVVTVRVLSVKPDGSRGVVSYSSKLGKGKLARALLEREAVGQAVRTVEDIAEAWLKAGGHSAESRRTKDLAAVDLFD